MNPQPNTPASLNEADPWRSLLAYVLQDELHNRLTPRVIDIAYTAFMIAKQPNTGDGGSSDWYNDARPAVKKAIEKLRIDLAAPGAAIDAREQEAAICGVLAGEPEVLGERCKDGGKCHHACTSVCFRRDGNYCGPLTGSRLNHDWSEPASREEGGNS